jgi:metal-responsive CopG/Arc/MetJ family transcriptional regulator
MTTSPGTRAKKVTISLPAYLFEWGENERARHHQSRSEFVAQLYRRYLAELKEQRRAARYAAAYAEASETDEEHAWAEASADALGDLSR